MKQDIVNSIEKLRPYTDSKIRQIQFSKIPAKYDLNLEQKWSYEPNGIWYSLWQNDTLLYICNNLPFIESNKPRYFCDTLDVLVANEIMKPIMIFANKKFIKWSKILLIGDRKYTYIMINDIDMYTADIDSILLPLGVSYVENQKIIDMGTTTDSFIFDSKCNYVDKPTDPTELYTVINLKLNNTIFRESFILKENQKQLSSLDYRWKLTEDNIILFQNGLLYYGDRKMHGLNIFSIDDNIFNSDISCRIFYFKGNESKDNIECVADKKFLRNRIMNSNNIPEYVDLLNIPFDVFFHRFWTYDQNITHALQCIMMYNSSLLDSVYKDRSNIESRVYSGLHFKQIQDNNHNVTLSRKIGDKLNNYPIIFLNGELYSYNYLIEYKNKDYTFPLYDNVKDNDLFEILYCKNIDNRVYKVFLNSGNETKYHYIIDAINTEDIKIFSEDLPSMEYIISRTNKVEFEINHHSEKIDDTHIMIAPDDPFYYDKQISLTSKKQFHHVYRKIKSQTLFIKLPDEFIYCNNSSNYMVFINHRRIDKEDYKITIPDNTKPFDDISVFVNKPLVKDDEIEIFYIGYDMNEVTLKPSIDLNGDVFLNREILGYGFNKYLYLIFINGKKIRESDISNIDSNKIRIINNQNTVKNLTIIKHIPDDDELKAIFDVSQDELTTIMTSISQDELNSLYPVYNSLYDNEDDIKKDNIDDKLVIYEIIRKYWMRPGNMQKDDPFLYTFEGADKLDKDSAGNLLVPIDGENSNYLDDDIDE